MTDIQRRRTDQQTATQENPVSTEQVLQAARAFEASDYGAWSAVSLYFQLFPGATRYRTRESGVSSAVQRLARAGVIRRVSPGRYRLSC